MKVKLRHVCFVLIHYTNSFTTRSLLVGHGYQSNEKLAFPSNPYSRLSKRFLIPGKDALSKGTGDGNSTTHAILEIPKNKFEEHDDGSGSIQQGYSILNTEEQIDDSNSTSTLSSVPIEKFLAGLPLKALGARTLDTFEDIAAVFRRFPYEKGYKSLSPALEATRKTIVLLGSGWANHALMKVGDCNKLRLIVVSPTNHFVFTPMLASAAVGTVEYRSMTEAVRAANPLIHDFLEGSACAVNVEKKSVTIQLTTLLEGVREGSPPTIELSYDHLVVAVGCQVDDKGVPGAKTKALRLKTCDDARRLRTAVGECLEYASRPDVASVDKVKERTNRATFLIVGGGATGVELAGELYDLLKDITRPVKGVYPKLKGSVKVILAHSGPDLVPQFEENLRKEALSSLKKKGVEVLLNTRVTEVGDGFAKLSTMVMEDKPEKTRRDEYTVPLGLTVWCAGTAPVPFVESLLQQLPESSRNYDGRIKVDRWMRAQMKQRSLMGSVLVLGDAAACSEDDILEMPPSASYMLLPQTAQVAGQQGAFAARLLNRGYDLTTTPPSLRSNDTKESNNVDVFDDPLLKIWLQLRGLDTASQFTFLNLGLLAYLGGGEALASIQLGETSLFAYAGSTAFILWRSVYLVKQVATRNRILVTFDWIKSALFGRDITRL
eukprot:CAMPEP_0194256066 /NCGR_PEP_ID=MMETSP0158-20130606/35914_1 /TAXON_ID=33649 /ORGANISM="Thalassionema nitzschioides, Strain L26-B" /LENGTH=661 /DNA_ID=CAMNT_0038994625 /DNA_START=101 /DNA_END=2086 /DNA_ORIENTATION=-